MLARKLLRSYGVSWSRWKGTVLQQCLALHAGPSVSLLHSTSLMGIHTASSESSQNQPSDLSDKGIGRFQNEQLSKMLLKPDSPADARILRVAIIGLPNSGKSTLTNSLMGWRVTSVSSKVHTTRQNTAGIYTQGNTQIVFLDTPGILSASSRKRHNLERSLLIDPERSLHHADLVCVLVDVSNKWTRNEVDSLLLQVLHLHRHIPAVLVLNKVDLMRSKDMLLQITRSLTQGIVDGQPVGVSTKKSRSQQPDLQPLFDAMEQQPSAADDRESGRQKLQLSSSSSTSAENESWPTTDSSLRQSDSEQQQLASSSSSSSSLPEDDSSWLTNDSSSLQQKSAEDAAWASYFERIREAGRAVAGMKGWPLFRRVFMVSALSGDGVQDIKDYLLDRAIAGPWDFHSSLVTCQDPRDLVLLCVREKLLEHLRHEVPYNIHLSIVLWEVDEDGMFNIIINASAQNRRQVSILLGPRGQTIQKIASEAKQEMMNAFRCEMRLKIVAKTTPPHNKKW